MTSFKINQEAIAQQKGRKADVPDELMDVYIMDRMQWDTFTLRSQPSSIIQKLLFWWHIQSEADKKEARRLKDGKD